MVISAAVALFLFFLVKRYAFDIVKVNNSDMLSTYNYGDALLIKKTGMPYAYGDVVYLEYPQKDDDSSLAKTFFFQRIVGTPGDTFELADKIIFLNHIRVTDDTNCRHNFFIKTNAVKLDSLFKLRNRLTEGGEISDEFDYSYALTWRESEMLQKDSAIKSISLKTENKNTYDEACFPWSPHYSWNLDHYGKLYIPRLSDTLRLDTVTINLYDLLITEYEKNKLLIKHDSIFINDKLTTRYVVKKNYYFVMGDNRDNANDSRSWGFLPENLIKGKVIARLKKAKP